MPNVTKKEPKDENDGKIHDNRGYPVHTRSVKYELTDEDGNDITGEDNVKRIVSVDGRISCPKCSYSTGANHSENLSRHLRTVHQNIRAFACTRCDYSAKEKAALKQHEKGIHDQEKEYKCEDCSYATARKAHLHQHIKAKHAQIRDVMCDKCEYTTSDKSNLYKHQLKMHDAERGFKQHHSFKCYYCSHLSMYQEGVVEHMQTKHEHEGSTFDGPQIPIIVDVINILPPSDNGTDSKDNSKLKDERIEELKEDLSSSNIDFDKDIVFKSNASRNYSEESEKDF